MNLKKQRGVKTKMASYKDYTILSLLRKDKERFVSLKEKYCKNPNCKDSEFLIDLMNLLEENFNGESEIIEKEVDTKC